MKPSEASRLYFDRAADLVDLDDSMRKLLLIPKREVQVQIPVEMDDGRWETEDLHELTDYTEAVEVARQFRPDVMFLDLRIELDPL